MRIPFLLLLLTLFCATATLGADAPDAQFEVHFVLRQGSPQDPAHAKVLAQPSLAVTLDREARFRSGGEVLLHGEAVDFVGTEIRLRISSPNDDKVRMCGKFLTSQTVPQSDGLTGTTSIRILFDRMATVGHSEKFVISGSAENTTWLEVQVENVRLSAD